MELEDTLQTKFPRDLIEAVPKGEHGGDALHRVCGSTAGMYGDMQGIAGKILQEIEGLDIKLLEANEDT